MIGTRRKLTARETVLLAAVACAAGGFILLRNLALPSYREWRDLEAQLQAQALEHTRLARNLAYKQSAEDEFARLAPEAFQTESEQMTLASWLRELEATARRPSLVLVNTKPLPVRRERGYVSYAVRLSVSGRLAEVIQFISDAANGATITGLSSFSMRGVQGSNNVECTFGLRMVRLMPDATKPQPANPRARGVAHAG